MCNPLSINMDTIITYNEVAALRANPQSIASCLNLIHLCILRHHLQHVLQRLSCLQSNIHGRAGLIMARPMYALLTTMLFRVPTDPGPLAIYYHPPSRFWILPAILSLTLQGNPCMLSPPKLAAPNRPQSMHASTVPETTGCWTGTYNACATMSSTITLTTLSSSPTIRPSMAGIQPWNNARSSTRWWQPRDVPPQRHSCRMIPFQERLFLSRCTQSPLQVQQILPGGTHSWWRSVHAPATAQQRSVFVVAVWPVQPWIQQLGPRTHCREDLDQPEDVHSGSVHPPFECNQHHGWILRVHTECFCRPPRIGWQWWGCSIICHSNGSVDYTE